MNRGYAPVVKALEPYGVPVVQIDMPMMEAAVARGGNILVVATHGPTVGSTQALLEETAKQLGIRITYDDITVEEAWEKLADGNIEEHNQLLADAIRARLKSNTYSSVVLAQISMSAFLFSYPDPIATFGIPVLTSGQCGFDRMRDLLLAMKV